MAVQKRQTVTDMVGRAFQKWERNDEVFLDCQTGAGKTYFITHVLHEYAEEKHYGILYLYNRIAVGNQQKISLLKGIGGEGMPLSKINELKWIGNIHFESYQGFAKNIRENNTQFKWYVYRFVIFDECHFFLSDSEFNSDIIYLWNQIKKNPGTTRIWVSATMDEIKNFLFSKLGLYMRKGNRDIEFESKIQFLISNKEQLQNGFSQSPQIFQFYSKHLFDMQPHHIWYYKNERNYDYIDAIIPFRDEQNVVQIIKDIPSGEKAVIFIAVKKTGERLRKKIENKSCRILNADEAKKNPLYMQELLTKETFQEDILISTKVLDNGVNLEDEKIGHIFMFGIIDQVDLIQMLGRKRQGRKRIVLYVQDIMREEFAAKLEAERETQNVCQISETEAKKHITDLKLTPIIKKVWTYSEKTDSWEKNLLFVEKNKNKIEFLEKYLEQFDKKIIAGFPEVVAGWLAKDFKMEGHEHYVDENGPILELLEEYEGREMQKEEQKEFRKKFKAAASESKLTEINANRRDRLPGLNLLNRYMEGTGIPYTIESEKGKESTVWKVVKVDESLGSRK